MKLAAPLVISLVVAAAVMPLAWSGRRLARAADRVSVTATSLDQTRAAVRRLESLRASEERVAEQKRPKQDLIARAAVVLENAGLPAQTLGAVRIRSDGVIAGHTTPGAPPYHRQTMQLSLRRLTLPELGRFLEGWTSSQQLWTPTQISLNHVRGTNDASRYDTTILVSATYVADR